MPSFIQDVLTYLNENKDDLSRLTFVLPSKRAGVFLLKELSPFFAKSHFAPEIFSVEEFIEELAQLKSISNTEIIFHFYQVYKSIDNVQDHDSFHDFLSWARILLHDFNEIDRYLVDPDAIFGYLEAVKDLNHWSMMRDQTGLVKNYMRFWKSFKPLYKSLSESLIENGFGYQGLLYREAVNNLETYIEQHSNRHHIFMGFNALNTAESTIIQELVQNDLATTFWDIDDWFLDHNTHSAGYFIRQYRKRWRYFEGSPFYWSHDHYRSKKAIHVIGTTKNIGQAKHVGDLISKELKQQRDIKKTAVILGDETLLIPVLTAMPLDLQALNVTMGLTLKQIPLANLFESWFSLHLKKSSQLYYRDVLELVSHSTIRSLYMRHDRNEADQLIKTIKDKNLTFIGLQQLIDLAPANAHLTALIFESWENNPEKAIDNILDLIHMIKSFYDEDKEHNKLPLEFLYRFYQLFNSIKILMKDFPFIDSVKALQSLYRDQLNKEALNFQGEPLQGLQIMGMLESRTLDFETVIITSVNEGILPSGQSAQSFIPYDLKKEYGLPTSREKDAVYAYHFYRLIQRAKTVYLLYNTEPDVLNGGEMSRFITQLEVDGFHDVRHEIIQPKLPQLFEHEKLVKKGPEIISKIKSLYEYGISPSALLQYVRNPIDFYAKYIVGIEEAEQVEEIVAANTLGTVIHETLRELYKPFLDKVLTIKGLEDAKIKSSKLILHQFKTYYKEGDLKRGKNLIILEIAKQYVSKLIDQDKLSIEAGNKIKLLGVEKSIKCSVRIKGVPFKINLKGQIDRIDDFNGTTRVIDYKTGQVSSDQVEIVEWADLISDYKASGKSFQVLMYAFMLNSLGMIDDPIEAGIISMRNLNSGFLKFAKKNRKGRGAIKNSIITKEILKNFEIQLSDLL
ncbi:MAG: PD-(D/E)XK nuclease family protein, partial [Flavobacteriaceae bacterium]|nr:PD-(D/E)XK nuclease family protein [Flavobacteriaceae bacterium]